MLNINRTNDRKRKMENEDKKEAIRNVYHLKEDTLTLEQKVKNKGGIIISQ